MEAASDEYLTALANKGIVKRAYKDKETVDAVFLSENGDAPQLVWQIGGERVTLVEPLAESRCSCPSRSICRHVILGILAARERFAAEAGAPVPAEGCGKEQESREPSVKRADMEARKEQKKASGKGEEREVPTEERGASEQGEEEESPNRNREASEQGEEKESPNRNREASEQGEEKESPNRNREASEQGEEKESPNRKREASEQGEKKEVPTEKREASVKGEEQEVPNKEREASEQGEEKEASTEEREASEQEEKKEVPTEKREASEKGEEKETSTEKREASEKGEEKEASTEEREASEKGEEKEASTEEREASEKEASTEKREASEQGEEKGAFNEKREALEQGKEKGTPKRKQEASEQGEERAAAGESRGQAAAQTASDGKRNAAPVWGETASYPLSELRRVLGIKKIRALLQQRRSGVNPVISGEQVLTVTMPGMKETVKLISPIAYAACTCHKKELCSHKATAILWCQLTQGSLTEDILEQQLDQWENKAEGAVAPGLLKEQAKQAAEAMQKVFGEMAASGLSRMSYDTVDALERLAAISHNAQLPRMENEFRALSGAYDKYFKRSATVKSWELICQTVRLYQKTQQLLLAESEEQIGRLGGEFRAGYLPVGELELVGVTEEVFKGAAGYAGTTVYFLEAATKKWYTCTHLRPTFYDGPVRRGSAGKAQAPWNLPISFEELSKVRLKLAGAKCESHGRLSLGQDTRGEVQGRAELTAELVKPWYYTDFAELFFERLGEQNRAEAPVFLAPETIGQAVFADKSQRLTMPLYDGQKREIIIEIRYSREEEETMRYLERLRQGQQYVFLGKLYVKESRIRMYPLALWERKNFARPQH